MRTFALAVPKDDVNGKSQFAWVESDCQVLTQFGREVSKDWESILCPFKSMFGWSA
jgi:hypothetical protein